MFFYVSQKLKTNVFQNDRILLRDRQFILVSKNLLHTGCFRIYDPILQLYKQQTGKDSTKAILFSERS